MEEEEREGSKGEDVARKRPVSWAGGTLDGVLHQQHRRGAPRLRDCREALSTLLWEPYEVQRLSFAGDDVDGISHGGGSQSIGMVGECRHSVEERQSAVDRRHGDMAAVADDSEVPSRVPPSNVSVVRVEPPPPPLPSDNAPAPASVTTILPITGPDPPPPAASPPTGNVQCLPQQQQQIQQLVVPSRRRRRQHRLPDLLDLPPPYTPPPPLTLPFHHLIPTRRRAAQGAVYREVPKSCCGLLSPAAAVSLRWFMVLLLTVGVCCALVGTVLGATRATAPHHLTIALLMIGVGIVLVTVSGVAWRLMSHDSPSCRAMLGLSVDSDHDPNRRFLPRLPPSYGRPHHPYAAMMYPEFQYRAPPPSYQASMQEYRLRLLLLDRQPASPPPTYRSHPTTLLRGGLGRLGMDHSRPPSYRSRTSSSRHEAHSRQASSIKEGGPTLVGGSLPTKDPSDHCTVTIVTEGNHHSPATNAPPGPVIVTISGHDLSPPAPPPPSDHIQILAHL